jgi:hypothetical protein
MPLQPSSTDSRAPDSQVTIKDFPGLMGYPDPLDLPAGAAISQTNLISIRPGEIRARGGYKIVRFSL